MPDTVAPGFSAGLPVCRVPVCLPPSLPALSASVSCLPFHISAFCYFFLFPLSSYKTFSCLFCMFSFLPLLVPACFCLPFLAPKLNSTFFSLWNVMIY